MINTGKVVSFIDNVIVGTEKEEEYDKIVEEIVKSNDWAKENKNGGGKGKDGIGLANFQWSQEYTEVFRTCQLL